MEDNEKEMEKEKEKLILDLNVADELWDYKDICICALRYAVTRHTYVVKLVCDYIKEHADIILDTRVISVMIGTIDNQLSEYCDEMKSGCYYTNIYAPDNAELKQLKEFLVNYDYSKFR